MFYDRLKTSVHTAVKTMKAQEGQQTPITALIAPCYGPLHEDVTAGKHLTYKLPGGRGSGKSSFISLEIVDGMKADASANAIIFRRVAATLRDSVYAQVQWAIDELGQGALWKGSVSPMQYTNVKTGQQILFRGLDDAGKLKSIKPRHGRFKYLWIEEFSELPGPNTVRSVKQSVIRGGHDFRIFYSFNPPRSRNNWANQYIMLPDPQGLTFKTDYRQMPPEWLGETFILEAENLRDINEDAYKHEYLGEAIGTGGEVFPNIIAREITDTEIAGFTYIYCGVDWGFSVDPFCFLRVAYDRKKHTLYLLNEIYKRGLSNADAAQLIQARGYNIALGEEYYSPFGFHSGPERQRIICDSAEPKSIADFRNAGLLAVPCDKYPGSVQYGVKWLQNKYIVIDPQRTPNAYREFTQYEYKMTKDGEYTTDLKDEDNHTIDALRYACDGLIRSYKESA